MKRVSWLLVAGLVGGGFAACGPDQKPQEPCLGPSIHLVLRAQGGPLPADTRINVRYGGNRDGEPYALGDGRGQAVFCDEDTSMGGASADPGAGAGAAAGAPQEQQSLAVWALRCRLFTQGPARLDATAEGYEPIEDEPLSLQDDVRCEVPIEKVLQRLVDAGSD